MHAHIIDLKAISKNDHFRSFAGMAKNSSFLMPSTSSSVSTRLLFLLFASATSLATSNRQHAQDGLGRANADKAKTAAVAKC